MRKHRPRFVRILENAVAAGNMTKQQAADALKAYDEQTVAKRVKDFAVAISGPPAAADVKAERVAICSSCPHLDKKPTGWHCVVCRCPQWRLADVRNKAGLIHAKCPIKKWRR